MIPKEIAISKLVIKDSYSTSWFMHGSNKWYLNKSISWSWVRKLIPFLMFLGRIVCGLILLVEEATSSKYISQWLGVDPPKFMVGSSRLFSLRGESAWRGWAGRKFANAWPLIALSGIYVILS